MARETRVTQRFEIVVVDGQADPEDNAPDTPWRYELRVTRVLEYRDGRTKGRWAFDSRIGTDTVGVLSPDQLAGLVKDGVDILAYGASTFNANLKAQQAADERAAGKAKQ